MGRGKGRRTVEGEREAELRGNREERCVWGGGGGGEWEGKGWGERAGRKKRR